MTKISEEIVLAIQTEDWDYISRRFSQESERNSLFTVKERIDNLRKISKATPMELSESDIEFIWKYFPKREAIPIKKLFIKDNYKRVFASTINYDIEKANSLENVLDLYLDYWHSGLYESSWACFLEEVQLSIRQIRWKRALETNSDDALVKCWMTLVDDAKKLPGLKEKKHNAVEKLGTAIIFKMIETSTNLSFSNPQDELAEMYSILEGSDLLKSKSVQEIVRNIFDEK